MTADDARMARRALARAQIERAAYLARVQVIVRQLREMRSTYPSA